MIRIVATVVAASVMLSSTFTTAAPVTPDSLMGSWVADFTPFPGCDCSGQWTVGGDAYVALNSCTGSGPDCAALNGVKGLRLLLSSWTPQSDGSAQANGTVVFLADSVSPAPFPSGSPQTIEFTLDAAANTWMIAFGGNIGTLKPIVNPFEIEFKRYTPPKGLQGFFSGHLTGKPVTPAKLEVQISGAAFSSLAYVSDTEFSFTTGLLLLTDGNKFINHFSSGSVTGGLTQYGVYDFSSDGALTITTNPVGTATYPVLNDPNAITATLTPLA